MYVEDRVEPSPVQQLRPSGRFSLFLNKEKKNPQETETKLVESVKAVD